MKKALLLSFALLSFGYMFGQLQVLPSQFDTTISASVAEVELHSVVKNTSTSGVNVIWQRTIITMPKPWDQWVCTGLNCFGPDTETYNFTMGAGTTADLFAHFAPNGVEGCAQVVISLTDANNPANTVSVTYNVCSQTTATNNVLNANSIVLYPNPTVDYFMIKNKSNVSKVSLSNIAGKQVKTFNSPRERYDVGDLNGGMYIVQLLDSKNKVIKTSRLSVQRP